MKWVLWSASGCITLIAVSITYLTVKRTVRSDQSYYAVEDFSKIRKIDAHVHIGTNDRSFMEQAVEDNFQVISINTEVPDYPSLDDQENLCLALKKDFPKNIFYLSTFETKTILEPGWQERALSHLTRSFARGAVGIKVWKNIGMVVKDEKGEFIMIDDPVFDTIFNYLEKEKITVLGHVGEPKNCWLPVEKMTVENDKKYFSRYPEYHMYLHPENPSYETLITARDNLLVKHHNLNFVGAHLGSMEWSVDLISQHLERFPNMSVDLTDRICHLQVQSLKNWQKVQDFFIRYQDRIIYGTDLEPVNSISSEIKKIAHETWLRDWKYFTTDETMSAPAVNGSFKGLKLDRKIIDKIYYRNAIKWYPRIDFADSGF